MNRRRRNTAKVERSPSTRPSLLSRLTTWRDLHLHSLFSSLGRLAQRPWASLLTVGVMAVALALPHGLLLAVSNVSRVAGGLENSRQLSVFLNGDVDLQAANALAASLQQRDDVQSVDPRTPEQGLAEF